MEFKLLTQIINFKDNKNSFNRKERIKIINCYRKELNELRNKNGVLQDVIKKLENH